MIEIKLIELRRLAIDRRLDITCKESASGRLFVVDKKGIARVPRPGVAEPVEFDIEEVLAAADLFIFDDGQQRRELSRQEVADLLSKQAKPAPAAEKE